MADRKHKRLKLDRPLADDQIEAMVRIVIRNKKAFDAVKGRLTAAAIWQAHSDEALALVYRAARDLIEKLGAMPTRQQLAGEIQSLLKQDRSLLMEGDDGEDYADEFLETVFGPGDDPKSETSTTWAVDIAARLSQQALFGTIAEKSSDGHVPADLPAYLREKLTEAEANATIKAGAASESVSGASLLNDCVLRVRDGVGPVRWPAGTDALSHVPLGPGVITAIGGPPGSGKTTLTCQVAFDALLTNPSLRVMIANVEMSAKVLLDRQTSRLAHVPYSRIRDADDMSGGWWQKYRNGIRTLRGLGNRFRFYTGATFDLPLILSAADKMKADLLLLDHLQRVTLVQPDGQPYTDNVSLLSGIMSRLRTWCDAGHGVLVVSQVSRQPSGKHGQSSYSTLNLASWKGSGSIEYDADHLFLLPARKTKSGNEPQKKSQGTESPNVWLDCVKARDAEPRSIELFPNLSYMQFMPVSSGQAPPEYAAPKPIVGPGNWEPPPDDEDDEDEVAPDEVVTETPKESTNGKAKKGVSHHV